MTQRADLGSRGSFLIHRRSQIAVVPAGRLAFPSTGANQAANAKASHDCLRRANNGAIRDGRRPGDRKPPQQLRTPLRVTTE